MARSYKSALPTWSTYTPHVAPMGVQSAVNQENYWGISAPRSQLSTNPGWLGSIASRAHSMAAGTGAAAVAAMLPRHQPFLNAMTQRASAGRARLDDRRQWSSRMQEALHQNTPERITDAGESEPHTPMQVRTTHTAPQPVNVVDVATQQAAQDLSGKLTDEVLRSEQAGTATTKAPGRLVNNPRARYSW